MDERRATGRMFGQWAAFAALADFFLWFAREVAEAAGIQAIALFAGGFSPLVSACWVSAGIFALVAVASRRWAALKRAQHSDWR